MSKATEDMIRLYKREVEQLRIEASVPRIKVSDCLQNLLEYTQAHKNEDFLASGMTSSGTENPFQEKKKCILL